MSSAERLYTPELLSLTIRLANYPLNHDFPLHGSARSKSCGSTLEIGLSVNSVGEITELGMRVQACAIGQASAAIFADVAKGMDLASIEKVLEEVTNWLVADSPKPEWPGFAALEPARAFKGRHGAMLLPWLAARDALSSERPSG